jgi:hypothetical protein
MSKMADLSLDITDMLSKGTHPATISAVLEVPVSWVYEVSDNLASEDSLSPFNTINS